MPNASGGYVKADKQGAVGYAKRQGRRTAGTHVWI